MTDKIKILHVEDDLDIQEVAKLSLEVFGDFEVKQCASGKEALEFAKGYIADILLLDVMMPEMSGEIVLKHLRELPNYQETPAIFMTARAQKDEVAALKALGAVDVIVKPFDPTTLAAEITKAIS
ncbi:response regulator [Amylibacter sp. SFDW26]|uniref:response regulator n=1 Tax=Amylibacter sp. SFDW26 TaxID=2652722 RepID=UPI00186A2118|nr:response regulator [Amylibacter sp. SFDW26]